MLVNCGIMQGRLTPPRGRGIQFFPFDEWQSEFHKGKELGLQEIEWIFDYERYEENPLWTAAGCWQLNEIIKETDVKVHAVCFDYFMRVPFYKQLASREENIYFFSRVVEGMQSIGATLIEVPMVDESSVQTKEEWAGAFDIAGRMADIAGKAGIKVGFETDMEPQIFIEFLHNIKRDNVYANYDSGNSSGLGYDHEVEINTLGKYIANIHIKDRMLHGTTVKLGTGNADFGKMFTALRENNYRGSFILQAARGEDGQEAETVREQLQFVKRYVEEYGIGE